MSVYALFLVHRECVRVYVCVSDLCVDVGRRGCHQCHMQRNRGDFLSNSDIYISVMGGYRDGDQLMSLLCVSPSFLGREALYLEQQQQQH
jgi:hypothetical protein